MTADPYDTFISALSSCRNVLITTHVRPDGDALGSTAALQQVLTAKGIHCAVLLLSPLPPKYAFVFEDAGVPFTAVEKDLPADFSLVPYDGLLVVDTGTWSQLPGLQQKVETFAGKKMVLDHHLTQESWADLKLVDTAAAAAGEIVGTLLERWGVPLDSSSATSLYLALVSDTGWFQYANTRPQTLRLAATLLEKGVDADGLHQRLYQSERAERLALQTRALASLKLLSENRVAVMRITPADFAETNATRDDTEASVNVPLQIGTVEVSALLTRSPEGLPVRISLRSKGKVNCAAVAQRFGGGGHARAAGCRIDEELADAVRRIEEALIAELI